MQKSAWIPWVFVGGMALVVAVNGVLVTAALNGFAGPLVPRAYERGRQYSTVLEEAARQDALGWVVDVRRDAQGVEVMARDRDGRAVPAALTARLQRPLTRSMMALEPEATGTGRWRITLDAAPGQWDLELLLRGGAGQVLEAQHRLVLP